MFKLYKPKNTYERKFILELLKSNFFHDLSFSAIEREIDPGIGYVFTKDDQFIGSITIDRLGSTISAFRLAVIDEPFRNQGIGQSMLKMAEDLCKQNSYSLIYIRSTKPALNFYKRAGFLETTNNEFKAVPNTIFMSKKIA